MTKIISETSRSHRIRLFQTDLVHFVIDGFWNHKHVRFRLFPTNLLRSPATSRNFLTTPFSASSITLQTPLVV